MTKKRKIKVPAALYGLPNISSMIGNSIDNGLAPIDPSYLSEVANNIDAKSFVDRRNVRRANFNNAVAGAKGIASKAISNPEALGSAVELLASPFITSSATTGKEAALLSVANVGKGAATGASIAGPVGAAAGALVGAIGSKGREAEMTSFTDYDEGTLGTGLIGAFSNKRLRRERERIKANAYSNRDAVRGTEYLANKYDMEYGDMNHNTFANGGSTNSLAYVDDGELINTPDGSTIAVPEEGKPTDSNLVSLPTGSRILSDKLKVPGSNETFAEAGKKIMKRKKSLSNDIYALNAAKLNEMNEQLAFDLLYDLQESVKAKRKIKPKSKTVLTFVNGGDNETQGIFRIGSTFYNLGDTINYKGKQYVVTGRNEITPNTAKNAEKINNAISRYLDNVTRAGTIGIGNKEPRTRNNTNSSFVYNNPLTGLSTIYRTVGTNTAVPQEVDGYTYATPRILPPTLNIPIYEGGRKSTTATKPVTRTTRTVSQPLTPAATTVPTPPKVDLVMEPIEDVQLPELLPVIQRDKKEYADVPEFKTRTNWLGLLPIIDNLTSATPERAGAVYNPYASTILNTMRGRRFDTRAAINDINRNRAVSNYTADLMNTNTGANMAYRIASQRAADDAIQALRTQESNVNNAYLADYANIANNLGQQWVQATNLASDINRRNRAQARNIRRAGLSGLSQWGQNETLMRNRARRDNAMMQLYAPFLQSGFSTEAYNNFINYLGGR